ncbi:hypothetical protein D918_01035 [Trichuris suis]|nr:hypothetical protein D918_01035 [Trichuris suis]
MKRPFGIGSVKSLKFAGAFGSCDDDDKVQLLALMSHSDSSSSDSSCDSMHSLDGNESATGSEEDCYETIFKDVFPNKTFHHCDHDCDTNTESLYKRQNKCESVVSKLADEPEKHEEPCEPNSDTTEKQAKAPAAGQEWVFTLYDFDGKGKVSKEDILSLVRSIYDVLGNAKLPIHNGGGNDNSHKSGQPVGAFKIKLSVMPDLISPTANQKEIKLPRAQRNLKPQKVPPERKTDAEQQCDIFIARDRSKNAKNYDVVGHTALRVYKRSFGNGCAGGTSHAETKLCASCNHRDYVNLSELENCCRDRHSCSGNVIHHIRHCDRHCHCPPIVHFSRNASNAQCYERLKRTCGTNEADYAPLRIPQTSCCKEQECIYSRLLAPTVEKKNQPPLVVRPSVVKQPEKKVPTGGHMPKVMFKAVQNHSVNAASKQAGKSGRPEHPFQPVKPSEPSRGDADGSDLFLGYRHYHEHHHYYYNC